MIKSRKILAVFLASPSDLQAERQYARDCVDEWNEVNADRSGWFVELMGWEDTLPQAGRPQEIINQEVDKCVLFVGMMHRLWGNPTGSGATSGFSEEFERAVDRFEKMGEPFISLFFKDMGDITDPGDQLSKVIAFRSDITESKKYFYKSLPSDPQFWSVQFRRNLHKLIFTLIDGYAEADRSSADSDSVDIATEVVPLSQSGIYSTAKLSALRNLTGQILLKESDAEVAQVDIARLRLISTSWQASGLAEAFLPTHDANIIFRLADLDELSRPEVIGLIETGLSHYTSGNAPIWRWIQQEDSDLRFVRSIALFSNEDAARTGAFELLALADDDFGDLSPLLEDIFPTLTTSGKNAVLRYIARTAMPRFEDLATSEYRRGEYVTLNTAILAVCAIKSSRSAEEALQFLLEENVFPNGSDTSSFVEAVGRLSDEGLQAAILHREPAVRAAAVRALVRRNLITAALVSTLKSDPSARVRTEAVNAARNLGEQISISDAATIIVRKSSNALRPGGKDGEAEFEEYREAAMAELPDAILELELKSYYSPANAAYKALLSRHWKSRSNDARRDIGDDFEQHFTELQDFHTAKYGEAAAKLTELPDNLRKFVASKRVRGALDVFALKGGKDDIRLFRSASKGPYFVLKKEDLSFFARFGDWSDIPTIASASRQTGGSLMIPEMSCTEDDVADTILKIAKNRLGECLKLDLPTLMKTAIVRRSSKAAFRRVPKDDVMSFLNDENDTFRRVVAVRVAETYSRSEAAGVLARYLDQSYLYYNVIHWLDLRMSASSATATFIAERSNASI